MSDISVIASESPLGVLLTHKSVNNLCVIKRRKKEESSCTFSPFFTTRMFTTSKEATAPHQGLTETGLPPPFAFLSLPDLEKKIKAAKTTGSLNISNQGLAILPRDILSVKGRLVTFYATNNFIPFIPVGFCTRVSAITKLALLDNRLTQLPGDFGVLTNLEMLDLSYNSFTAFPEIVTNAPTPFFFVLSTVLIIT